MGHLGALEKPNDRDNARSSRDETKNPNYGLIATAFVALDLIEPRSCIDDLGLESGDS